MAIDQFSFSKTWRSASDFPTYEPDETQVREDLQCLHDELAAYVNETVVPRLNADESGIQQNTQAISDLQTAVAGVTLGQIPDGSLTAAKLAPGGAAGWEDVTNAITLTPTESSEVEVAAKHYFFSRTLGVMVFFLQLSVTVDANDSVVLDQTGYLPAALYLPSTPLNVHRRGCVAFLRGYNDLSVWVASQDALSQGTVCVSGWYFCNGPAEEES